MKLAIMQPYFLPYIGYFQLLAAVDRFVVYDDVNFINRGWINRNNLLQGGKAQLFTIPLLGASQNKLIKEVEISVHEPWQKKLLKTVQQSYQKAPYFAEVFPLIESIIRFETHHIGELAVNSLCVTADFLGLKTEIIRTSSVYQNEHLKAQQRILDICLIEEAHTYINPPGGMELYSKELFLENGIELFFLKSISQPYSQLGKEFVPWLSILDVLMFNSKDKILELLGSYELI